MKIEVGEHQLEISNPDKLMFPESGVTKGDLATYYYRIGETMLPHVRGRAVTMHRFPDGITAEGFYQKDLPDYFPDWIERARLPKEEGGEIDYLVVEEPATLVFMADQGSITPHVTLSEIDNPYLPDRMVFDMDPPDGDGDLGTLHRSVRILRSVLEELDLRSQLMTTGSRGYHILVRLDRSAGFDETREFARRVGEIAATRYPDTLTVEQRKAARQGRVFIDYLRNSSGQTTVAPYALRALPGAPVATPLDWDELVSTEPQQYRIDNIFRRLAQKEDPWAGLATRDGHDLSTRLDALQSLESEG